MPPFAFAGLAVQQGAGAPRFHVAHTPEIAVTSQTFWRGASISKIVVGRTASVVLEAHASTDVSTLLGWPLRNPRWPDVPITVAQVASHTAGFDDTGGYVVPDGQLVSEWVLARGAAAFGPHAPGAYFHYSNLGYLILASLCEAASGEPFHHLARTHVLEPLGIEGGFNWAGMRPAQRQNRIATYRRDAAGFEAQIDSADAHLPDVPERYVLDRDVARLSPQGGLRLSLAGALTLAQSFHARQERALWTPSDGHGDTLEGVFEGYGWGVQLFEAPTFYPRSLMGHFANAYGFVGGVWYDREADIAFAYALNGLPVGDEDDAFCTEELQIFDAVAAQVA